MDALTIPDGTNETEFSQGFELAEWFILDCTGLA